MHHFSAHDVTTVEIYSTLTGERLENTLKDVSSVFLIGYYASFLHSTSAVFLYASSIVKRYGLLSGLSLL
jgi:hypothetical protein